MRMRGKEKTRALRGNRFTWSAVAFAAAIITTGQLALAQSFGFQSHIGAENANVDVPRPVDPNDHTKGWKWPGEAWPMAGHAERDGLVITSSFDAAVKINRLSAFRRFGLDNVYGRDHVKTFTLEFDYSGGRPELGDVARGGVHPVWGSPTVTSTHLRTEDDGSHFRVVFRFSPQPDWEFVTIANTHPSAVMTMTNIKMRSVCVPTPGSSAVLGLGVLVCASRRRRRTAMHG